MREDELRRRTERRVHDLGWPHLGDMVWTRIYDDGDRSAWEDRNADLDEIVGQLTELAVNELTFARTVSLEQQWMGAQEPSQFAPGSPRSARQTPDEKSVEDFVLPEYVAERALAFS